MKIYANKGGNSDIEAYDYGGEWITIRFKSNVDCKYEDITSFQLNSMKTLADEGQGLRAFINGEDMKYSKLNQ